MTNKLDAACQRTLIENMRPGLKAVLDRLLRRGLSSRSILTLVRPWTGGPDSVHGGLVHLGIMAYLGLWEE